MEETIWTFCFSRTKWCAMLCGNEWVELYPDPRQERAYSAFDYLSDAEACARLKEKVVAKIPFDTEDYFCREYFFGYLQDFTISNEDLDICFDLVPDSAYLVGNEIYLSWRMSLRPHRKKVGQQNHEIAWTLLARAGVLDTECMVL